MSSANDLSFEEEVDETQTDDVQEVKDSGRQRMVQFHREGIVKRIFS